MKVFMGLGKLLTVAFWAVVVGNWLHPVAQPFAELLNTAGAIVIVLHVLELWWFSARIKQTASPLASRVQVLLFGVFHALALPAVLSPAVEPVMATPVANGAVAEPLPQSVAAAEQPIQPVGPDKEPEHA